jgi:uncharacterized OB-fold protein
MVDMTQVDEPVAVRRPLLDRGELTAGFWEAASREVLALQRCETCAKFHHPPVVVCSRCHGLSFSFAPVATTGTVSSFSIMREPRVVGFESIVPYAVLVVELDDPAGMFVYGNLVGVPADQARVGLRVGVRFEPYGVEDVLLPQWAPLEEGSD